MSGLGAAWPAVHADWPLVQLERAHRYRTHSDRVLAPLELSAKAAPYSTCMIMVRATSFTSSVMVAACGGEREAHHETQTLVKRAAPPA